MTDRLASLLPLDPTHCALLVIDMQVAFVKRGEPAAVRSARDIIPAINRLAVAVRGAGGVVAYTRHTIADAAAGALPPWERSVIPDAVAARFAPGAGSHALHPAVANQPDDLVIDKYRYSALAEGSSPLDAELRRREIDTVIVTGTVTNVCCESTARDAHSRDYRVVFVADATARVSATAQAETLTTMGSYFAAVADTDAVIAMLEASAS